MWVCPIDLVYHVINNKCRIWQSHECSSNSYYSLIRYMYAICKCFPWCFWFGVFAIWCWFLSEINKWLGTLIRYLCHSCMTLDEIVCIRYRRGEQLINQRNVEWQTRIAKLHVRFAWRMTSSAEIVTQNIVHSYSLTL